jgi:hypothetical protein
MNAKQINKVQVAMAFTTGVFGVLLGIAGLMTGDVLASALAPMAGFSSMVQFWFCD